MNNFYINKRVNPRGLKKDEYDVIIIGAGIGGLVCGCYLAKVGMKVLIVEKNDKPGGYCTSFERDGYRFDAGVHAIGGIKGGVVDRILRELEIKTPIKCNRIDPTDKIIMPDSVANIRANPYDTIKDLKKIFYKESNNIDKFFKFIMQEDFLSIHKKIKKLTFRDILESFFNDYKLKSALSALLFTHTGLADSKLAALTATLVFRVQILNAGYYPIGGVQIFPDLLTEVFKERGGNIILSQKVTRILTHRNEVDKVIIGDNDMTFEARSIVANIGAKQLFEELLDIKTKELQVIDKLVPTFSVFALYIGLKTKIGLSPDLWYFFDYDINNMNNDINNIYWLLICPGSFHDPALQKESVTIFTQAPYKSKHFWENNKFNFADNIINKIEETGIQLNRYIAQRTIATPITFYEYTLNDKGSAFGWAATVDQINPSVFPQRTSIPGLFLAGHWCNMGTGESGVIGVALSGRNAARKVLLEKGKKWDYRRIEL